MESVRRGEPKLHILFAIRAVGNPGGGAERVLSDIMAELDRRGHRISLITFDAPDQASFYPLPERLERHSVPIGRDLTRSAGLVDTLRRLPALRRVVRRANPDIVVGFMHSMYLLLAVCLIGSRVPIVASEHAPAEYYAGRPLQRLLLQHLVPRLTAVGTVPSLDAVEGWSPSLAGHLRVIPNPIGLPIGSSADPVGSNRRQILAVGSLLPSKGFSVLVDAFARLAPDFPEWDLEIVGEGPLRPELQMQIEALGLDGRARLVGATSRPEEYYLRSQVVAVPSTYESFGMVVVEALAFGLPVVGSADAPGVRSLVRDGETGLLVEGPDRITAFADGLRRLMGDAGLRKRLGERGPASVAHFSVATVTDMWETLLHQHADRSSRGSGTGRPLVWFRKRTSG